MKPRTIHEDAVIVNLKDRRSYRWKRESSEEGAKKEGQEIEKKTGSPTFEGRAHSTGNPNRRVVVSLSRSYRSI